MSSRSPSLTQVSHLPRVSTLPNTCNRIHSVRFNLAAYQAVAVGDQVGPGVFPGGRESSVFTVHDQNLTMQTNNENWLDLLSMRTFPTFTFNFTFTLSQTNNAKWLKPAVNENTSDPRSFHPQNMAGYWHHVLVVHLDFLDHVLVVHLHLQSW